jgi:cyclic pyranopterin phosphate synthase
MTKLTHVDDASRMRMVDVGEKPVTSRRAVAEGFLVVGPELVALLRDGRAPKGGVLEAARLAGIQAAKRTSEMIPLSHPVLLDHVQVDFEIDASRVRIVASVSCRGPTGVEMEALTAVAIAGLTAYDMLKSRSRTLRLEGVRLLAKSGGRSGDWSAPAAE